MDKIRLLIIEDNTVLREGLIGLFKDNHKLEVGAGSGDEDKFDQEISQFNPHVILLNADLKSQNSLEVVPQIKKRAPNMKMVVMGLSLTKNEIIQFMAAGAVGFIFKEASLHEFIKTIDAVAKGEIVIPELLTDLLLSQIVEFAVVKRGVELKESVQITKFELILLKLINEGLSNREIGKKLDITPEHVKSHIHNIKQNLSLFSLLELVNIISPQSPTWENN